MNGKIIRLDDQTLKDFGNYQLLVDGNNALQLRQIPKVKPVEVSQDENVIQIRPKRQEIVDKMHQAAIQINQYGERTANDDPGFAPRWSQEEPFTQAVEQLPEITKRKFWEKTETFFRKNGWYEMLPLGEQLDHLEPLLEGSYEKFPRYDKTNDVMSPDEIRKKIKTPLEEEIACSILETIFGIPVGVMGAFGTSSLIFGYTNFSTPPDLAGTLVIGTMTMMMMGMSVSGSLLFSYGARKSELQRFEKYVHNPLVEKSKKADEIISLVKCLASD